MSDSASHPEQDTDRIRHRSRQSSRNMDRSRSPRRERNECLNSDRSRDRSGRYHRLSSRSPRRSRGRDRSTNRNKSTSRSPSREQRDSTLDEDRCRSRSVKRSRERSRESSVDSSSEDSEQRRRRKKRKKKRKEEKRQRRKEKKKQRKKDKLVLTDQWGKYGVIRACDIYTKSNEFGAWLVDVKGLSREEMSNTQEKQLFEKYMEDFNTATLPHRKYYNLAAYEEEKRTGKKAKRPEAIGSMRDEERVRLQRIEDRDREKLSAERTRVQALMESLRRAKGTKEFEKVQNRVIGLDSSNPSGP